MNAELAILSDVHGNLEALEAVLQDIEAQGVPQVVCLGDLVGYGPDPVACVERVLDRCAWTLRGYLDKAFLEDSVIGSQYVHDAIAWNRELMPPGSPQFEALAQLPRTRTSEDGSTLYVHTSPREEPDWDYLLLGDLRWPDTPKWDEVFAGFERRLFVGHTHIPAVIDGQRVGTEAKELGNEYPRDAEGQVILNVGSVGKPRDLDPRACYLLVTESLYVWRRVEYDVDATVAKIDAIPQLAETFGRMLRAGV